MMQSCLDHLLPSLICQCCIEQSSSGTAFKAGAVSCEAPIQHHSRQAMGHVATCATAGCSKPVLTCACIPRGPSQHLCPVCIGYHGSAMICRAAPERGRTLGWERHRRPAGRLRAAGARACSPGAALLEGYAKLDAAFRFTSITGPSTGPAWRLRAAGARTRSPGAIDMTVQMCRCFLMPNDFASMDSASCSWTPHVGHRCANADSATDCRHEEFRCSFILSRVSLGVFASWPVAVQFCRMPRTDSRAFCV